ncbi:MAG: response regulator [Phycisphaeraceae bacterium]|nr:response regulator [Phycisphaeraceae bacterium]
MNAAQTDTAIHARADQIYRDGLQRSRASTDRMFAGLMLLQWIGAVLASLLISPRTWIGETSTLHIHVWVAAILGGVIASLPFALAILLPGRAVTRHCIATAQMAFSMLLIHLSGGRIETHFHIFGSLAFLAVYRDWKVLMTATVIVAVDHWARGLWWPMSVFGTTASSGWRWLEHAAWVIFEVSVLLLAISRGLRDARGVALGRAEAEQRAEIVGALVDARTLQLEDARAEAEAASRAKSTFLANMSHEIRTPMTAVLGFADLIQDPSVSPEQRDAHILTIRRNGEHLLGIINDILDLSKIEARQMDLSPEPCCVRTIVTEIESLMRIRAAEKGITLESRFEYPQPVSITTDPLRLRQILMNLVGNAVKFTESGSITVVVHAVRGSDAEPMLRVDVTDTGIGMSKEAVARLFTPFTQVDTSPTRRFGGSGLGLAISRRIAELMGGSLSVRSSPGAGSTFTLAIPTGDLSGVAIHHEPIAHATAPDAARNDRHAPHLRGRILLAEDGPDNQRLIAFHLRKAGADIEIVPNGEEAIRAVERAEQDGKPFSAILMDMQMPKLDGYDATRALRASGRTLPIIALTAHAMQGDRERCLDAGCTDYQTKPINAGALLTCIARHIERDRSPTTERRGSPEAHAA